MTLAIAVIVTVLAASAAVAGAAVAVGLLRASRQPPPPPVYVLVVDKNAKHFYVDKDERTCRYFLFSGTRIPVTDNCYIYNYPERTAPGFVALRIRQGHLHERVPARFSGTCGPSDDAISFPIQSFSEHCPDVMTVSTNGPAGVQYVDLCPPDPCATWAQIYVRDPIAAADDDAPARASTDTDLMDDLEALLALDGATLADN